MNRKHIPRVCLAAALSSLAGVALGNTGTVSITSGAQPREVLVSVQNGPTSCGIEVRFSDGREARKRLEPSEAWSVSHSFAGDGIFGIQAEGVTVVRGLRTVGPCGFSNEGRLSVAGPNATLQVATAAPAAPAGAGANAAAGSAAAPAAPAAPSQGAHQDMMLVVRKNANTLKFVNTLEGGKRLSNGDELARSGTSLCIVKFPNAYGALPDASVDVVARTEVRRYLAQLTGGKEVNTRSVECIANDGNNARFQPSSDLVLVQRQALPILINSSPEFAQSYESLQEISHTRLFAQAEQMRQAEARRQEAIASRAQELDALAQANSTDKVGSMTFGLPRGSGQIAFCTLSYEGERGSAIVAYGQRGLSTQSEAFRAQAERTRATVDSQRPYVKVYPNVEAVYEARQTRPDECVVYVDYPANLKRILAALQRDNKTAPTVGPLVASTELRDEWAKRAGYRDYAEFQVAREMRVNAQQFKALAEYKITDKASLDAAIRDMQTSRYNTGTDVSDVLSFLKDQAEAAGRPGATALSVREARQKAAREAAEASAAAERRRREEYAKEYPFIAVLSCGMPGHINIMACFAGGSRGVDTELRLRNGSNSAMYKVYNLQQAGQERRDGFHIDLRRNFDLRAQNADSTLILSLKIIDRVTGNVLHQDQASRFGVVAAQN